MVKKAWMALGTAFLLLLLPGCMYGNQIKQSGAPASAEFVGVVQAAVDQYRTKTGVLPIRNKDQYTPEMERFLVDFKKLKDAHIMSTVPVNAFENGGTAVYVIIRTESKPEVKLMDLVSYQQIVDLQKESDRYRKSNGGAIPAKEQVAPGLFLLDWSKLGRKPETVRSPYSRTELPVIVAESGQVLIDYSTEIMKLIDKKKLQPKEDDKTDLRNLLLDESAFIPAHSVPYYWLKDRPVPTIN